MIIASLKEEDFPRYDQLASEYGTIFNSTRWLGIFGNKIQVVGIYNDNDELIGGFHLYTEKHFGLTVCRDAPLTPHCGPFLKVMAKNHVAVMDSWKKAISLMSDHLENQFFSLTTISLDNKIVDTQPFIWRKYKVIPNYTYLINLDSSIDVILKNMSPERRNDIKKGERDGLTVKLVREYQVIQSLVGQSFSRQNLKIDETYLKAVLYSFANPNNSYAIVAEYDERPIAAAFCIHDRNIAYYLLGGYSHDNKHRSAGPMVCIAAIKHAHQLGLKTFDFEGSMVPAIESYFRGFGGEITPYYRINKAFMPIEIALKFIKRELF